MSLDKCVFLCRATYILVMGDILPRENLALIGKRRPGELCFYSL